LFGFGCVGYGLHRALEQTAGIKAEIVKICVKHKDKQRPLPESYFTYEPDDIFNDAEINVVVELIDDSEAAFTILKKSLKSGKAFVTANKKLLAEHFTEILELQYSTGLPVLYEAAACASIPIIRNLEEYYDNDTLRRIEGVINGSTNYILTKMQREGISFETALQQAQELGYAESDPALDIKGLDARNKLLILCAHAFGVIPDIHEIPVYGIDGIGELESRYAREKGLKIKLLATAVKTENNKVSAIVSPAFVSSDSPLYGVDDVFNGVITETAFADRQFFSGKGAGDFPTASAVLSDLSALSYDYRYEYKKILQGEILHIDNSASAEAFVRYTAGSEDELASYFTEITELYKNGQNIYLKGKIQISEISRLKSAYPASSLLLYAGSINESISVSDKLLESVL
jgi:homoserine dehydrogenase